MPFKDIEKERIWRRKYRAERQEYYNLKSAEHRKKVNADPVALSKLREARHGYMKKYNESNKFKNKARRILNQAVKSGVINKTKCVKCGKDANAHHPDYSKPLEIIWLCRIHHLEAHNQSFGYG